MTVETMFSLGLVRKASLSISQMQADGQASFARTMQSIPTAV